MNNDKLLQIKNERSEISRKKRQGSDIISQLPTTNTLNEKDSPNCQSPTKIKDSEKYIKFRSVGKRTVSGSKNGKKKVNQDSIFIDTHILGKEKQRISVFAVFDGHGQDGDKVSRFLISNLKETFISTYKNLFESTKSDQNTRKNLLDVSIMN
jgi:hypothetical protein